MNALKILNKTKYLFLIENFKILKIQLKKIFTQGKTAESAQVVCSFLSFSLLHFTLFLGKGQLWAIDFD